MIFPPTIDPCVPDDAPTDLILGWRTVHPDLRSGHGYRYPYPGQWATAPGPILDHRGSCPKAVGDGICVAHTWSGARSGGIRSTTWLLVGYRPGDILGDNEPGKVRVSRMLVLDVFGPQAVIGPNADLTGAYLAWADLAWADLTGADLTGADLAWADLAWADLTGADLTGADLTGADLTGADLTGARGNRWTRLPAGWRVDGELIVRADA